MIFEKTELDGVYTIKIEKVEDERGFFARTWDKEKFQKHNLDSNIVQCNISFNRKKGTLRGMHYQTNPYEETKLVHCTKGKIYDVIIDLRQNSSTFEKWQGIEIGGDDHIMLYIPKGIAHGFQTLEDNTEIFYQMSQFYMPEYARGIKWNDDYFKIDWPIESPTVSEKDSSYSLYKSNKNII